MLLSVLGLALGDLWTPEAEESWSTAFKVLLSVTKARIESLENASSEETSEPKDEESISEEPKASQPNTDEPKAEESVAEDPKAEEPKAGQSNVEEPKAEEVSQSKSEQTTQNSDNDS